MKATFGIAALAAMATVAVWERSATDRLRTANQSLREEKLEADQLAAGNPELSSLRASAGNGFLDGGADSTPAVELLRLRAEVSRLRGQPQEAARLQAENERITSEIRSGKFAPRRLADMEGFISRETWATASFATPETAAQSFFAAVVAGDVEQLLRCMAPEAAEALRRQLERNPEQFRQELFGDLGQVARATGFRIAERSQVSEDWITLGIQFAADGKVIPLPLHRINNEWKMDESEPPRAK